MHLEPQVSAYRRGHRVWGVHSDSVMAVAGIDACPWYWDGVRWSIDAIPQLAYNEPYEPEGLALWGSSPEGLWLVGAGGRLLHHDASAKVVDRTTYPGPPQARYKDVFEDSRDSLLHVAVVPGGAWATSASQVLFFGPSGWAPVGDIRLRADSPELNALFVLANDDVWVGSGTVLHHWNGSTWSDVTLPSAGSDLGYFAGIYAVWASAPNDIWVARGLDLLHFDGAAWTAVSAPQFVPENNDEAGRLFTGVGGTTPNDVWVAAFAYGSPWGEQIVYHYDGARLTEATRSRMLFGASASVWARAHDDVWVTTQPMLHWNGTLWQPAPEAVRSDGSMTPANPVWGRSATDLWFLATTTGASPQPITRILHWDGTHAQIAFESRLALSSISGSEDGTVFAVGQGGATLRLVGPASTPR
jgi:hypothetical protein